MCVCFYISVAEKYQRIILVTVRHYRYAHLCLLKARELEEETEDEKDDNRKLPANIFMREPVVESTPPM